MEKKSLFSLVFESNELTQKIIENNGELPDDLSFDLEEIETSMAQKVDNYAVFMDRLDMESDYWGKRADEYAKVSKSLDNLKKRIKSNIKEAMLGLQTTEILGNDMRFKLSKTKPKTIYIESNIPDEYKKSVVSIEIDKDKIAEALKRGESIPGVVREEAYSLRKYANRTK